MKSNTESNIRLCRLRTWPDYKGLGFNLDRASKSPVVIQNVESNSPAAAGGLRMRDVILRVNNQDVSGSVIEEVTAAIRKTRDTGDYVELHVIDEIGYEKLSELKRPFDLKNVEECNTPPTMSDEYKKFPKNTPRTCQIHMTSEDESFGFSIFGGEGRMGAYIQYILPNSPASRTELRINDRILEIDDKFVDEDSKDSIDKKLSKAKLEVKLYVVDTHTYKYFKDHDIPLESKKFKKSQFAKDQRKSVISSSRKSSEDDSSDDSNPVEPNSQTKYRQNTSNTKGAFGPQANHKDDIRLCTIYRADEADRFGFSYHDDEDNDCYKVKITSGRDQGPSNAELAGVKEDDCLIEINGEPVEDLENAQMKELVTKTVYPQPLKLLVADVETYKYYQKNNEPIRRNLPSVKEVPPNRPGRSSSNKNSNLSKVVPKLMQSFQQPPPQESPRLGVLNLLTSNPMQPKRPGSNSRLNQRSYKLQPIKDSSGYGFSVKPLGNNIKGHKISQITPGSPADKEDLPIGCCILSVNGHNVQDMDKNEFKQFLRTELAKGQESDKPLSLEVIDEDLYINQQSLRMPDRQTPSYSQSSSEFTVPPGKEAYPEMRLCIIRAWPRYKQLGFDIVPLPQASLRREGCKIQKLDVDSPAARTHIHNGDYIIEVNGDNIEAEDYQHVDELIHERYRRDQRIKLLVIDTDGYQWYKNRKYPIDPKSKTANIVQYQTPDPPRVVDMSSDSDSAGKSSPNKHANAPSTGNQNASTTDRVNNGSQTKTNQSSQKPSSILQSNRDKNASPRYTDDNLSLGSIDIVSQNHLLRICRLSTTPGQKFGFDLSPNDDRHIISNVVKNSPAARSNLNENDRLIQIDDVIVTDQSQKVVMDLIQNASRSGKLRLLIAPSKATVLPKSTTQLTFASTDNDHHASTTLHPIYSKAQRASIRAYHSLSYIPSGYIRCDHLHNTNHFTYEIPRPKKPWPRECVVLRDASSSRCGFRVTKRENYDTPIIVDVNPNSPAQRSGLNKGDHIIYVESRNVQQSTFQNIVDLIKRTFDENGQLTLVVLTGPAYHELKRRGGYLEMKPFSFQSTETENMKPRLCKLKLSVDDYDFGFTLKRSGVLFVQSVEPNSLADLYNIKEDDVVLELNGHDIKALSMNKISEMIESSKQTRELEILVIDPAGYEFSITHAIPINSHLPFVEIKAEPGSKDRAENDPVYL
ncbi:unnamed protein product [Rotaria magnacalcarata]|uniref:PDZ domain-containing protein n=1 Tax=Rotaria magnacalcarata TaxID=392030 RepID=A0A816RLD2_9BILA|nr:unnamed protein product [Rotaria magnacalcarata]